MKIAVLENTWIGHHAGYCTRICQVLVELGHNVTLFCPKVNDIRIPLGISVFHLPLTKPYGFRLGMFKPPLQALKFAHDASAALRTSNLSFDLLFFPSIDKYCHQHLDSRLLASLFPAPFTGIYFAAHGFWFPTHLTSISLKSTAAFGVLDEESADFLSRKTSREVFVFPDFSATTMTTTFRSELVHRIGSLANGRTIILLAGDLRKRKGLLPFLKWADSTHAGNFFFVVVGKLHFDNFSTEENQFIERMTCRTKRCFIQLSAVDDNEFDSLLQCADLIWVCYESFPSSSNLITKAAQLEKPVLVASGALLEQRVRKFQLGAVAKSKCPYALREAALLALTSFRKEGAMDYSQHHSLEKLKPAVEKLIAACDPM
ncbi:MAG: glycosyltransferase family 4 protein [Deltaproteobacteria bacterium]|nr:glycosyltransferase family 4 protein [Deltaproteobacteria bacterium]